MKWLHIADTLTKKFLPAIPGEYVLPALLDRIFLVALAYRVTANSRARSPRIYIDVILN